jgi:hypothetical protein
MYCAREKQKTGMKESKVKELFVDVSYEHVCGGGKSYNEMPTKNLHYNWNEHRNKIAGAAVFTCIT